MGINAVSSNDALYNLAQVISAARQRNAQAFGTGAAAGAHKASASTTGLKVSAPATQSTRFKPYAAAMQNAEMSNMPHVPKTKILGNFFDVYA
jgi:hypothetical protein